MLKLAGLGKNLAEGFITIHNMLHIAITLCTYKRPFYLKKALHSILTANKPSNIQLSIIVIDNEGSPITEKIINGFPKPSQIEYHTEIRPGLVHARNKALRVLKDKMPDYIGFIDDDEVISKNWIIDMLGEIKHKKVDILAGPIHIEAAATVPNDLIQAYQFKIVKTFQPATTLPMGNIFFNKKLLALDLWFDEKYNHIGGEDIDFMRRAHEKGLLLARTPKAPLHETLVPEKATYQAYFQRQYRVFKVKYLQKYKHITLKYLIECLWATPIDGVVYCIYALFSLYQKRFYIKSLKLKARLKGRLMAFGSIKSDYGV